MRQRLLVLMGSTRRGTLRSLRSRALLASLAVIVAGCASHSLVPKDQAEAIKRRDQALASHADAIQAAIRQSGAPGGLAFLDADDGRLVVVPGETPADAWARHVAASRNGAPRVSVPTVLAFVHRADVARAPESVSLSTLHEQHALRTSLAELWDAQRRSEEKLGMIQRELAESVAVAKRETDRSLAAATGDMQRALSSLAEELAAARRFMLQTAQLGWLNHELTVENASGIRKVATASQELTATSGRLAAAMRQLSEDLARQLKELAGRLDAIQSKMGDIK